MEKPELLAPAGNLEKLKIALIYGADAIYAGGKRFGLRSYGGNFTYDELALGAKLAHQMGKKIYVTVNTYPHNSDLSDLPSYLQYLQQIHIDAILVSDIGVFSLARKIVPSMEIHISTQANSTNWAAIQAWQSLGATRVVLARELSKEEVWEIRQKSSAELEMFVHGAMCISYSGRCLLSDYLTNRDANRGGCAQPCRWRYSLIEEKRPGQMMDLSEDKHGTYILNSKDMCLLPCLADIIASGINSLKIEGRMKSAHYVATVVKVYREAIDSYFSDKKSFAIKKEWLSELDKVSHRLYTTGFYNQSADGHRQIYGTSSYIRTVEFIGLVLDFDVDTGLALVEQRNNMKNGQQIEVLQPCGENHVQFLQGMFNEEGDAIDVAPHAQQLVRIKMEQPVSKYSMLRRYL